MWREPLLGIELTEIRRDSVASELELCRDMPREETPREVRDVVERVLLLAPPVPKEALELRRDIGVPAFTTAIFVIRCDTAFQCIS